MGVLSMRRARRAVAALAVCALGALAPAASAGEGNFLLSCGFDHAAGDDPIVFPGLPGQAHEHAFLGAAGVTAFSTTADLIGRTTRCAVTGETVAVWHPRIVRPDGRAVDPTGVNVYYRNPDSAAQRVLPFPTGLRHIHGNAHNRSASTYAATYRCLAAGAVTSVYIPASCPNGAAIEENMWLASCWDGESLNPPDHKPLVACDGSKLQLPAVNLIFRWPNDAAGGSLTSDLAEGVAPGLTSHADYWFAADPFFFAKVVERCLNRGIQCRVSVGADGPAGSIYAFSEPGHPTILTTAEANP